MSIVAVPDLAPDVSVRARVLRRLVPSSSAIAWMSMVVLAAVRAGTFEERDPYWEARAGLENLRGVPLARPDTWSWAPLNHDFFPNSPAWNVMLGIAWWVGGFWGLFVLGFLAIFGFFAVTYLLARKLGAHPLGALAGIVAGFVFAVSMISYRGTLGVQILLVVGLLIPPWWRPRLERLSPWANGVAFLVIGAALGTVGNWIHLSFFYLGPALAVSWGVYWLASDWPGSWRVRLHDPRRWALTLSGAAGLILGSLATPYGVAGTIERSRETAAACAKYIMEWVSPFDRGLLSGSPVLLTWPIAAVLAMISVVWLGRWWIVRVRGGSIDNRFALISSIATLAVPLAVAGDFALRFLGSSILLFMPVWGTAITWLAHRLKERADGLAPDHRFKETALRWTQTVSWRRVLTIVWSLLFLPSLWLSLGGHSRPIETAAIESLPTGCRLFTTASIAGPTILLREDVLVWLDGRADYYGQQRLEEAQSYFTGVGATAAPPGATCAVLPAIGQSTSLPLATARLNADPAWTLLGSYNRFDVWVRTA
jgi:hypothetical protein